MNFTNHDLCEVKYMKSLTTTSLNLLKWSLWNSTNFMKFHQKVYEVHESSNLWMKSKPSVMLFTHPIDICISVSHGSKLLQTDTFSFLGQTSRSTVPWTSPSLNTQRTVFRDLLPHMPTTGQPFHVDSQTLMSPWSLLGVQWLPTWSVSTPRWSSLPRFPLTRSQVSSHGCWLCYRLCDYRGGDPPESEK
jgi:hypothetical protein